MAMKLKYMIPIASLGGVFLLASCKESSSTGSGSGESAAPVDPATVGHVLYSETLLLPVGTVETKTDTMNLKDAVLKMSMQGQEINGTMNRHGESVKVRTIDSDTQITVEIQKDQAGGSMEMNGQPVPQADQTEPLHGQTVVLTKTGDAWAGKLKEGTATPEQTKAIEKTARNMGEPDAKYIFGDTPRKVGDSWDVDPTHLSSFGGGMDKLTGTFKVTFESIAKHAGLDCAVIVAEIDLKGKTDEGMDMQMIGKVTTLQSIKYCVAITFKMEGKMIMDGAIQGGAGTMHMEGPMKMEGESVIKLP